MHMFHKRADDQEAAGNNQIGTRRENLYDRKFHMGAPDSARKQFSARSQLDTGRSTKQLTSFEMFDKQDQDVLKLVGLGKPAAPEPPSKTVAWESSGSEVNSGDTPLEVKNRPVILDTSSESEQAVPELSPIELREIELDEHPMASPYHPIRLGISMLLLGLFFMCMIGWLWAIVTLVTTDIKTTCIMDFFAIFGIQLFTFGWPVMLRNIDMAEASEITMLFFLIWFMCTSLMMMISIFSWNRYGEGLGDFRDPVNTTNFTIDETIASVVDFDVLTGEKIEMPCEECSVCQGQPARWNFAGMALYGMITSALWISVCMVSGSLHRFILKEYPFSMGMMIDLAKIGKARKNVIRYFQGKPTCEDDPTYESKSDVPPTGFSKFAAGTTEFAANICTSVCAVM